MLKSQPVLCEARSDPGLTRQTNEDRFHVDLDLGLFVVCDGMGGQHGGEVASQLTIEAIREHYVRAIDGGEREVFMMYDQGFLPQTNRLASAVRHANQVVYQSAKGRPECRGMGTTVVAALLQGSILSIAHVGDSRLYLIRGDTITTLTADHSWVAEQVRSGTLSEEEAQRSSRKRVLTRAIGIGPTVNVELEEVPVRAHDILLLCSDGLTRGVDRPELLLAVRETPNLTSASARLIDLANTNGGEDNTTVVLVAVLPTPVPGLLRRMVGPLFTGSHNHSRG